MTEGSLCLYLYAISNLENFIRHAYVRRLGRKPRKSIQLGCEEFQNPHGMCNPEGLELL